MDDGKQLRKRRRKRKRKRKRQRTTKRDAGIDVVEVAV